MKTGIKHKPIIEERASLSLAKFLSFCMHYVLTWDPCLYEIKPDITCPPVFNILAFTTL